MCDVSYVGDGPAFWDERWRRARTDHRCDGCNTIIKANTNYVVDTWAAERGQRPDREKICGACFADRAALSAAHDGDLFPLPSFLKEAIRECMREDRESAERWAPMLARIVARGETTRGEK